jgi:hypothetical protein
MPLGFNTTCSSDEKYVESCGWSQFGSQVFYALGLQRLDIQILLVKRIGKGCNGHC